jgi:hypothetical protein
MKRHARTVCRILSEPEAKSEVERKIEAQATEIERLRRAVASLRIAQNCQVGGADTSLAVASAGGALASGVNNGVNNGVIDVGVHQEVRNEVRQELHLHFEGCHSFGREDVSSLTAERIGELVVETGREVGVDPQTQAQALLHKLMKLKFSRALSDRNMTIFMVNARQGEVMVKDELLGWARMSLGDAVALMMGQSINHLWNNQPYEVKSLGPERCKATLDSMRQLEADLGEELKPGVPQKLRKGAARTAGAIAQSNKAGLRRLLGEVPEEGSLDEGGGRRALEDRDDAITQR